MARAKVLAGFWLRLVCFTLVLCVALGYTVYVLTPKHDYGICPMTNLYQQADDSIDVLVLGTSCGYAGVNTNVLWEEYGIAAYNLCGAEQPYWVSYYYLEEALKTQSPKLLIVDAKAAIYQDDYSKRGRTILSTYGIRSLDTRLKAIAACVREEDFAGFALAFPELHSYYSKVEKENFTYPPTNGGRGSDWKGYIEMDATEQHERPSLVWTSTKRPLNARQQEYFEKLLTLAQEHEIPVLLVGFPNPDYANDHMYYNSLWSVASKYYVRIVNYNDPDLRLNVRYSSDFADWQHLNIKGSVTFSRRLGSDLCAMYDLPDRRGEAAYDTWQKCADTWYAQYPQYRPTEETKQ